MELPPTAGKTEKKNQEKICNLFGWADVATIERASKREKMRTFLAILPFQFSTDTPVFGTFG